MNARININVSAINYDETSRAISKALSLLEERTHRKDEFTMTDSEFAFGWHFFITSVSQEMIEKLAEQMGTDFDNLKGKTLYTKFLTWLDGQIKATSPRFKLAIKEEMESSRFGIF